jgi:hypothetical protein
MVARTAVIARLLLMDDSDRMRLFAAVDELRCVMQDEHRTCVSRSRSLSRAAEMPCKNLLFADAFVRQNRYAAFVAAQSWQANGMLPPICSER